MTPGREEMKALLCRWLGHRYDYTIGLGIVRYRRRCLRCGQEIT